MGRSQQARLAQSLKYRAAVDENSPGGYTAARLQAPAQVAELVDAQVSGTCGRKVVEVRVFSWAPEAAYLSA